MKIKTSELTGAALDWAVELAKGTHWSSNGYFVLKNRDGTARTFERNPEWRYSTDWSQGGPIIEREKIEIRPSSSDGWFGSIHNVWMFMPGPTPLIAAMRCYVVSKLGDEIEIPEELT